MSQLLKPLCFRPVGILVFWIDVIILSEQTPPALGALPHTRKQERVELAFDLIEPSLLHP